MTRRRAAVTLVREIVKSRVITLLYLNSTHSALTDTSVF